MRAFVLIVAVLAMLAPHVQAGRLDETSTPSSGPNGNQTANEDDIVLGGAGEVRVFITDEILYGFSKPGDQKRKLGNEFYVYVESNITVRLRVLIDDRAMELSNGATAHTAMGSFVEYVKVPNLRKAHLELEVNNRTLEYGSIRFYNLSDVRSTSDDSNLGSVIEDQIRTFTGGEFTLYVIQVGVAGLVAVLLGIFAGYNRAKESEETEQSYVVAY